MKFPFFVVCFLHLGLVLTPMVLGQQPAADSRVVVLRNGNVLIGRVDLLGDAYRIATDSSEIRLPARDVVRVVGSLLEAYEAERVQVRANSAEDHLRLAAWCIRQEMWPQAARELKDTRQIDPHHPALSTLQRRLQVASRAAMRASQPPPAADPLAEQEAEEQRAEELRELEKLAASLPPGSLEEFTRHIQPILVNGCAAAGCHSMEDKQPFRLNRDLLRGIGNRESTLRNLAAVWEAIDHENVDYSPLVMQPAVPHGGLTRPVFAGPRQKLQERLLEWIRLATGANRPMIDQQIELASHEEMTADVDTMADDSPHFWELGPDGQRTEPRIQRGLTPKQFQPKDEFDPAIFNRRQGRRQVEEESTPPPIPSSPAPDQ